MAIMASMPPELRQIAYAGSDCLHPIWFHFSKEGPDHAVQNRPRSDLDLSGLFCLYVSTFWLV